LFEYRKQDAAERAGGNPAESDNVRPDAGKEPAGTAGTGPAGTNKPANAGTAKDEV